uniref:Uncharacterized protein n=1 Tax=Rhizophora mucronata TaxID=61149 RepID=A0A2P2PP50_RHIMU
MSSSLTKRKLLPYKPTIY